MDFLEKTLKLYELLTKAAKDDTSEVASIAVMDGTHLLMGKRRDNGRWTLPGGHLDKGEEKAEGAVRELFEEAGIKVGAKDLKYLGSEDVTTYTGKKKKIHAYTYKWEGERPTTKNDPDKEVGKWEWVDCKEGIPTEVAENSHTPVDKNCVFSFLELKPAEKKEEISAKKAEKPEFEIYKSNYGPKPMKLYDAKANTERKMGRTGTEAAGAGPNKEVKQIAPGGRDTSKNAAKRIAAEARRKSKFNPVKIYSKDEIAQMKIPLEPKKKLAASELAKTFPPHLAEGWIATEGLTSGKTRNAMETAFRAGKTVDMPLKNLNNVYLFHGETLHDPGYEYHQEYAQNPSKFTEDPITIARHANGTLHVLDGQHRFNTALKRGEKSIKAHVFDVPAGHEESVSAPKHISAFYPSVGKSEMKSHLEKANFFDNTQDWRHSYLQNSINNDPNQAPQGSNLHKPENYDHYDLPSYVLSHLLAAGAFIQHPKRGIIQNRKHVNRGDSAPLMRSEPGDLELVHYSPMQGLREIDPNKMGTSGVRSGGQYKYGIPDTKTSFHYIKGTEPEDIVTTGAKSKYKLSVSPQHLYDLHQDPKGLVSQAVQENQGAWNTDMIFGKIKENGYKGIWAPNADHPVIRGTVQLFHPHPVEHEEAK